ncbi:TetR/AcrR family transcriptional regulator [Mesorhizobium abyssinicae]|uniref:TetR/AcrR family transcriptional regulator n=1 Tax=Mesorhizobium abyssinicae TaxID=1209958 RepID=UPI0033983B18
MPKPSARSKILEAGLAVMFRQGYHGAGVRDVVAEAGVAQGSFTNHFRSKEDFAAEVLDLYFSSIRKRISESLLDAGLAPRQRLLRYLDIISDRLAADGYVRGCLIGDFSLEVVQESEPLRQHLVAMYREWLQPFSDCIAEAQAAGEIDSTFTPRDLAEFLLASWEGAILRMKVERSGEPLRRFKDIAFATVFGPP